MCVYFFLDLECKSNIRKNQLMIGESHSLMKPDILKRWCAFRYNGSYNGPLQFVWMKHEPSGNIWRDKVLNSVTKEGNDNIFKVVDEIQVSMDMDGMIFECYLVENDVIKPCELPTISVQCEFLSQKPFYFC